MRAVLTVVSMLSVSANWAGIAVGENDDVPKVKFDGWKYTGATELGTGPVGPGGHYAVLATTDGLDKVVAFYEKKTGEKLTTDSPGGQASRGGAEEAWACLDDSVQPGVKHEMRLVTVRVFVQRKKEYYVTLVISRAKGEDHTHISLTYLPN
jgi:hypothetical protein